MDKENYKICSTCKNNLPETEEFFSKRKLKNKIIFQGNCKKCNKEYKKKHYLENKDLYKFNNKKRKDSIKENFNEFRKSLSCKICKENRWWVLDFHHLNPKEKEYGVAVMLNDGYSIDKILKEVEKCIVLCSNCHRDLHYKENNIAG